MCLLFVCIGSGLVTSPFRGEESFLPSDPVPVDAIQISRKINKSFFTSWEKTPYQNLKINNYKEVSYETTNHTYEQLTLTYSLR